MYWYHISHSSSLWFSHHNEFCRHESVGFHKTGHISSSAGLNTKYKHHWFLIHLPAIQESYHPYRWKHTGKTDYCVIFLCSMLMINDKPMNGMIFSLVRLKISSLKVWYAWIWHNFNNELPSTVGTATSYFMLDPSQLKAWQTGLLYDFSLWYVKRGRTWHYKAQISSIKIKVSACVGPISNR